VERGAIRVKRRQPSVEHGVIHDRCDRKVRGPALGKPEQLHSWGWVRVIRRSQRGALSGKHGAIRGYHRALSEECGVIRKWNKEPSFEPGVIHVRGGAISIEDGAI